MKCPNDNATLVMTERNGVEIDYCPECRGVWLDRGELDKIVERSTQPAQQPQQDQYRGQSYSRSGDRDYHKPKKKESFLRDLFDF
jgi:Zn-finger nucleic acid-binding protein